MKKYEANKMKSFGTSCEIMNRNKPIWEMDDLVKNQLDKIQVKINFVNKNIQLQKKESAFTDVKSNNRTASSAMALKVSASAVSYAVSIGDIALEKMCFLSKTELDRLSEIDYIKTMTLFKETVTPLKAFLKKLDPGDIETLSTLIDEYKASAPAPEADKDQSQTATYNIGQSIKDLNAMFATLDKHMAPYQYTNPDFFRDYKNSRKVINL